MASKRKADNEGDDAPWLECKSILKKRVSVVWNRDFGISYGGVVTEYNPEAKRHKVEFDDGDERWFRMERKIFSFENEDGSKITYQGEMQLKRHQPTVSPNPPAVVNRSTTSTLASSSSKAKKPKSKSAKRSVLMRAFMAGTIHYSPDGTVLEGHWGDSKRFASEKKDPEKTFRYEQRSPPTPVALQLTAKDPKTDDTSSTDSDDEDEPEFRGGNCVGWLRAITPLEHEYQRFEDEMMLQLTPSSVEDDDGVERAALQVYALGGNASGVYRVSGTATRTSAGGTEVAGAPEVPTQQPSGPYSMILVREYISVGQWEEEAEVFNQDLV
jgi:hypothetical protein